MRSTSTLYVNATHAHGCTTAEFNVQLPFVDTGVPVIYLFQILGVASSDIVALIVGDASKVSLSMVQLVNCIVENSAHKKMSNDEIMEWIGKEGTKEHTKERRQKYVDHILCR